MNSRGRRLRVALVGAGLVGQAEHAHFLWEERERFELAGVVDASPTVRRAIGERYGVPLRVGDLAELAGAGLDALVCAVPDGLHRDVVVHGLELGLHVLCEKPLALSTEECDDIAAARDRTGLVVQVGYMKRHDPAFRRLLTLLPERAADVRLISVEVNDPDQLPFVDHLPMVSGLDVPPEVIADGRARFAARCAEALGEDASPAAAKAFEGYLSSMVHDVDLVHGVLDELGMAFPPPLADAAWWDAGRGVSLTWSLPDDARVTVTHLNLPGVNDYTERLTVFCSDRILELVFPSPYLRHEPTQLTERRSDGPVGLRTTAHRVSYEEAFREELRSFHTAICSGGPVLVSVEDARADVAALLQAFQLAARSSVGTLDSVPPA
jgi:predicted dehydrogenase